MSEQALGKTQLICFKHHLVPLEVLIAYCSCQVFDQNGDGLISGEELKMTMRSLGETLTEDEVKKNQLKKKSLEKI